MIARKSNLNVLLWVSLLSFSIIAGPSVPDTTKTSAKLANLLTDPANVDKLDKAISAGVTGVVGTKVVVKAIKAGGLKDFVAEQKPDLKGKWKELVLRYKNPKVGVLPMAKLIQEDVLRVITAAADRIDMWRNTLPTIQGYQQSVIRLANNTVKVFKEFKVSDLWDIDRKWSRNMESAVQANISNFHGFLHFLDGFKGSDASDRTAYLNSRYVPITVDNYVDATNSDDIALSTQIFAEESGAMEAGTPAGKAYLFFELPKSEMLAGINGLVTVSSILDPSYQASENGSQQQIPNEQQEVDDITEMLNDDERTYLEELSLLAHIKQLRIEVETQRFQLSQQSAYMSTIFARSQMIDYEVDAAVRGYNTEEMKKIMGNLKPKDSWKVNR